MMAFDTDVLTEILMDNPVFVVRAATIPRHEQAVPVVMIEEILRGRLQVIRHAESHAIGEILNGCLAYLSSFGNEQWRRVLQKRRKSLCPRHFLEWIRISSAPGCGKKSIPD
jgi:hypothetical protein